MNEPEQEAVSAPAAERSAVVYHAEQYPRAEEAIPAQETATNDWDESINFPSNAALSPKNNIEEEEEGKAGIGKIGGVGERKERDEKGEEEKHESRRFFPTDCGKGYYLPEPLLKSFMRAYGESFVNFELEAASQWLMANPHRKKTVNGTGRYLSAWIRRSFERKQQEQKASGSSLLAVAKGGSNEGW